MKQTTEKEQKIMRLPNMLMIGSTARNAGKTELARRVVARFRGEAVGLKVTTVHPESGCPRGGEGCGVCSELEEPYQLTRESDQSSGKDTSRLLKAGAKEVYWLRVRSASLQEGITAFLDLAGPLTPIVCESNSLRRVVEPGVFLQVTAGAGSPVKKSAGEVSRYVDRSVESNGARFDLDMQDLSYDHGEWRIKRDATAIILAGGKSSRMKRDKSLLPIGDVSMIQGIINQLTPHFRQLIISANQEEKYSHLGVRVVADIRQGHGPLMGLVSALEASSSECNFVTSCDTPEIDLGLVKRLIRESRGQDGAVPVSGPAHKEPLFAVYRKSILKRFREQIRSGSNKIDQAFASARIRYVELGSNEQIINLNTEKEYRDYLRGQA